MSTRLEKDFIGTRQIPLQALHGIHSLRAYENFPHGQLFPREWYLALGTVKLAAYYTYQNFKNAASAKFPSSAKLNFFSDEIIEALIIAATEVSQGKHFKHFIVPGISGGAGTSINMNINEIIANRALIVLDKSPGQYEIIDPIEHANVYQSTNDIVPTALKIALNNQLTVLEESINELRKDIEKIETAHQNKLRTGYTQMQSAVPTTFGRLFGSYNEALSRDWWRVSKCFERLKQINLGGGAAGTSLTIPRYFVANISRELQKITNMPLARSENLADATSNLDSFVEVHAILKSHAVNLEKMVSDLRMMASDLSHKEISLPNKQAGSSIMPGKVNPVIPEYVISCAHKVYANDSIVTNLSAQGMLELNPYLPIIGISMIESLNLLITCDVTLRENLFSGLTIDSQKAERNLYTNPSISTALLPYVGYHAAGRLADYMKSNNCSIFEANEKLALVEKKKLDEILKSENLIKEGFSLNEL